MSQQAEAPEQPARRLRADKHAAIMSGGRQVFAREGFARASIDAIATASTVSTRTIYKHFADKSTLFATVIADSAARVAEEETELVEHHLADVAHPEDIQAALVTFATAWLSGAAHSETHRALIGQVHAEAGHLGTEIVAAWWQAGPGRVLAQLAAAFARLDADGLLRTPHPERAAVQFSQLVSTTPGPPTSPLTTEDRESWIADGVALFVRGCQP